MCGRFAMDDTVNDLITEFVETTGRKPEDWKPGWQPSWNIAPTQDVPLFLESERDGDRKLRFENAFWSIVPPGASEMKPKFTFNARADKLLANGLWRASVKSRRGIILANGYYEWQGEKGHKIPHFIHYPDGQLMGFAALYSWWREPDHRGKDDHEGWHLTSTIVTSDAVQTLADIHDRNPVILPQEMWLHWIDPTVVGDQALVDDAVAAGVAEASTLEAYQVAKLPFGADSPELTKPIS